MSSAQPPPIDYDALVAAYDAALTTHLRGFSAGPAFLQGFVPDEDPVRGILSVLESAREAGLSELVVRISPKTAARIDATRLRDTAAKVGEVTRSESEGGVELRVRFGAQKWAVGEAASFAPRPRMLPGESKGIVEVEAELHTAYHAAALALARDAVHEGPLADGEGRAVRVEVDGIRLSVAVDASTHTILRAAHEGAASELTRGALEGLCLELAGLPMLEAGDHGALRLELRLRAPGVPLAAPGIVHPERGGRALRTASRLLGRLLSRYREQAGFAETENRFWREPAASWAALDDGERLTAIKNALSELEPRLGFGPDQVVATSVFQTLRVRLEFAAEILPERRRALLLCLEGELRRRVEPSLVVEREARPDLNVIRRL